MEVMEENEVKDRAGKQDKPKPRRTGQRTTLVAGKKYVLRVFLGRDAAKQEILQCEAG
jgi:hypothetical protein